MELEQIIRQIYRIPITDTDKVSVLVNGQKHEVVNLGSHGVGILLSSPSSFRVNNESHTIDLLLDGEHLQSEGEIVHITQHGSDNYLCGIKLVNMDEKKQEKLLACVFRIRARLFTKE
jgi:c-di-GMP-binding flagellar brake protein YcgR